jgi:hypothetical protein
MMCQLQPVRVSTGSADEEGQLVFREGQLVAVLVQLSHEHGRDAGRWVVEAGFGPANVARHRVFANLKDAQEWVAECVSCLR